MNRHEHIRYGESILKCSILKSQHINNVAAQYLLGFNSNIKRTCKYIALYDSMPKPNRNKRIVAYIVCSISLLIQAFGTICTCSTRLNMKQMYHIKN